jgi:hypothetical protein
MQAKPKSAEQMTLGVDSDRGDRRTSAAPSPLHWHPILGRGGSRVCRSPLRNNAQTISIGIASADIDDVY